MPAALRSAVLPLLPVVVSQARIVNAVDKEPFQFAEGLKYSLLPAAADNNRAVLSVAVNVDQSVPLLIE